MTDSEIVRLFFERDEEAIRKCEEKYGKLCHSIAYNILKSYEDAGECVNDTYLALWNTIPPKEPQSLKAYAASIARNQALKRLERQGAQKRQGIRVDISELEAVLPSPADEISIDSESLGRLLNKFLLGQKKIHRQIFVCKYWYFDSIEDICASFGYSQSRVKSILYRTRCKLKIFLEKEGFDI